MRSYEVELGEVKNVYALSGQVWIHWQLYCVLPFAYCHQYLQNKQNKIILQVGFR